MEDAVVVVGIARTAMGSMQGDFVDVPAHALGGFAIAGALQDAQLSPASVDEVLMGCVLAAGQGQAPARQAALAAGIANNVPASTVNKVCGSGMKTVIMACHALLCGDTSVVIAGGMENMSRAPYLMTKARGGYRLGHGQIHDHMFMDGLEDAYTGRLMGTYAEATAEKYGFTRAQQDDFAIRSLARAQAAITDGAFDREITPVTVASRAGERQIATDEQPGRSKPEKIPLLKPAFTPEGTVTAANASAISDGAAALVLMRESTAGAMKLEPIARIRGVGQHAQAPEWFTTAPIAAIQTVLTRNQWAVDDVDLFEINEAFAVVTMAAVRDLGLDLDKVNIHGGACALGHPIGASGARLLVTLIAALQRHGKKRGIAALCIGGGEGIAMGVELV